ncbi:MAG TPA: hypothetical protein VM577_20550, partial [Anaerovoracaceae bacterium]|nr:hypothetical protein [Anaerovoracaceae bacterium]
NREHTFCQQLQKIEQQESALINERAEREQAHRTQLKETREQIETSILEHKEQVEFLSQRCCELEQARQQQLVEQSHELAAQEQGYIQRLSLAQQNFETQAQEIAKREKEYFLQIQEMQGTHAQQMQDLHRANCEREACEGGKLAQALQKLHDQSLAHSEREKTFFQVVLETERACLNQVERERERESTEREKFLLEELTNARREVQSHLIEIARRENCFSSRLQKMVASYELKNDEHSREQLEHLKALDLQAVAQKELLNSVDQRCAEIENKILPSLSDLQEMAASYELKNDEHSREQLEYLRALDLQAIAQKELLNSVDHRFAEIESKILPSLSEVNRELNATRDTRSWRYTAPFRLLAAMVGIKQTTRPAARLPDTPDDRA